MIEYRVAADEIRLQGGEGVRGIGLPRVVKDRRPTRARKPRLETVDLEQNN